MYLYTPYAYNVPGVPFAKIPKSALLKLYLNRTTISGEQKVFVLQAVHCSLGASGCKYSL